MLVCPRCHHLNVPSAASCELCNEDLSSAQSSDAPPETPEGEGDGLTAALLDVLEQNKQERARGEGPRARNYMLRPLPVPDDIPSPSLPPASAEPKKSGLAPPPLSAQVVKKSTGTGPAITAGQSGRGADAADIVCNTCGNKTAPGNRFCGSCGARLPDQRAATPPPPPGPSARRGAEARPTLRVNLVCINEDGSDGTRIPLDRTDNIIGRTSDSRFSNDAFLSPKHTRCGVAPDGVYLEDLDSLNGTFVRIREAVKLVPGHTFLMGRQVLRLELFEHQINPKARSSDGTRYMGSPIPTGRFKLLQIGIGGVVQNVYCVPVTGAVLGRERGDITFPGDKFMSARHAQISIGDDGELYLTDLNSSNGTWTKIAHRHRLRNQDFIFLGQQLFRVELNE